ncbi:MAG: hypothetical protein HY035_09275 [Nitrospirae bacterium]|nr:hypothetical protein [Nitrospirota bacterium]MBI3378570.1 hypothetical protein [Nitrospirota bacterium]
MKYEKEAHAVCLGDLKQAALYFDRVFYILAKDEFCHTILLSKASGALKFHEIEFKSKTHEHVFYDLTFGKTPANNQINKYFLEKYLLLPISFQCILLQKKFEGDNSKEALEEFNKNSYAYMKTQIIEHYLSNPFIPILDKKGMNFRDFYLLLIKSIGINNPLILLPSVCGKEINEDSEDITVSLNNLALIDTSKASWDQILEIRKDENARKKLRNLRLFFYENYQNKSKEFIEDDLKKIDDYKIACKDYGLQTCLSAISATMNSKNLVASSVAGLSAAFFGGILAGIGTATAIELGNVVGFDEIRNNW